MNSLKMIGPQSVDIDTLRKYSEINKSTQFPIRQQERHYNLISTLDKNKQVKFPEQSSNPSLARKETDAYSRIKSEMINQNFRTLDAGREKELSAGALQAASLEKVSNALPPLFSTNIKVDAD